MLKFKKIKKYQKNSKINSLSANPIKLPNKPKQPVDGARDQRAKWVHSEMNILHYQKLRKNKYQRLLILPSFSWPIFIFDK